MCCRVGDSPARRSAADWHRASLKWNWPQIVIARRPEADVAISQYTAASWENNRRNRNCFPEIAPQGHFLALRAQGAAAPLGPRNDKLGGVRCFDDSLYESQALRRERLSAPLQGARSRFSSVHALEHHRVFRAEHSAPVAAFLVLRRRQIELVVLHGIVEDILPVLPALRQVEDAVRGRIGPG